MKNKAEFPVNLMCQVLKLSRSGFYEWNIREPSARAIANQELLAEVKTVYETSDETYGSPRVTSELKAKGISCSKGRVARVMHKAQLFAVAGRKFKPQTTDSNHSEPISENVVNQDFSATAVGQKVGCDITYIPTAQGWLYLAVVVDFYSRKILGHAFSNRLESGLVCEALIKAIGNNKLPDALLHHSDRGSQYASFRYRLLLKSLGITQSMSRAGNCYDNALVESFFHSLKVERIHRRKYLTRDSAKIDIENYITYWYNSQRRHSSLGMLSPKEFLNSHRKAA
jgi:putative transposase